jgi:hypothetical protein
MMPPRPWEPCPYGPLHTSLLLVMYMSYYTDLYPIYSLNILHINNNNNNNNLVV